MIVSRFTIVLLIVISFVSCTTPTPKAGPTITPDTTGYYAARELKGLGYFILGQSTFKMTVNKIKKEMRENKEYRYDPDPFWSEDLRYKDLKVFRKDTSVFYRDDYLLNDVLACPNNDKIELYKYFVGGLELSNIYLEFYNDTLIAIHSPDYGFNLLSAFHKKYGEGIQTINTISIERDGKDNYRVHEKERIWHNDKVKATYEEHSKWLLEKGEITMGGHSYSNDYFTIELQIDNRREEYNKCEGEYKRLYESRREALADEKLKEL